MCVHAAFVCVAVCACVCYSPLSLRSVHEYTTLCLGCAVLRQAGLMDFIDFFPLCFSPLTVSRRLFDGGGDTNKYNGKRRL